MGNYDLLYADVAGAVYHAPYLFRRNMSGGKNRIIVLDKHKNPAQLRKQYTPTVRHANAAGSSVLSAIVFCIHRWQPNDFSAHFKCGLYRFGIQSARFIVQSQSAVHDKGIALKCSPIIDVAQRCTRYGGAVMPFDDNRPCPGTNGSGGQLYIVISALTNIRRCVNMHINDAVQ